MRQLPVLGLPSNISVEETIQGRGPNYLLNDARLVRLPHTYLILHPLPWDKKHGALELR